MKKIREILFTMVMIASCVCLLNVNTFASLPENNGHTNTQAASGESFSNDLFVEPNEKELETILDKSLKYNTKFGINCFKIFPEDLDPDCGKSLADVLFNMPIKRTDKPNYFRDDEDVYADYDGTVLFRNNGPVLSRVTTYRTNMVDGTMIVESSTYPDLSEVCVFPGQEVKQGQKIGERIGLFTSSRRVHRPLNSFSSKLGPVGYSTGPHLHFQTKFNGVEYSPLDGYDNTNNHGRRPKTYEEWLAEKEENEREGNFTEPSRYMEEKGSSKPNS